MESIPCLQLWFLKATTNCLSQSASLNIALPRSSSSIHESVMVSSLAPVKRMRSWVVYNKASKPRVSEIAMDVIHMRRFMHSA